MNGGLNLNYFLEYLFFTPESQYLERKSARKKPRELLKTLIGFANADGGILVIGVEDDGRITGFNHSKAHSIESFQQIGDHIRVLMYDDRLSIESPGKLPNIVTIENIREERFSRNPRIARILSEFGWVREMNEGVKRIYSEMAKYYLHDPVYTEPGNKVVLTLENSILTRQTRQENLLGTIFPNYDELSLVEKRLVQYMYNTGEHLTTSKAINIVNRSRSNVSKILGNLRALGIVEWFGSSPRDKRQYYKLNL